MDAEKEFRQIVLAFEHEPGVSFGSKGKTFGANALKVNNKIFAMLSSRTEFVLKLPRSRVEALIAAGQGRSFETAPGRAMKEWIVLTSADQAQYLALSREALAFVDISHS